MFITTGFYWDQDEQTRAFSRRYFERMKKMPTMMQAAVYSAVLHYLKAIKVALEAPFAFATKRPQASPNGVQADRVVVDAHGLAA